MMLGIDIVFWVYICLILTLIYFRFDFGSCYVLCLFLSLDIDYGFGKLFLLVFVSFGIDF